MDIKKLSGEDLAEASIQKFTFLSQLQNELQMIEDELKRRKET